MGAVQLSSWDLYVKWIYLHLYQSVEKTSLLLCWLPCVGSESH